MTRAPGRSLLVPVSGQDAGATRRVVGFPAAGRGVASLSGWRTAVAPDVELFGVRLPGRESAFSDPLPESVEAVASAVADRIVRLDGGTPGLPTVLVGHSLGASLAFATTLVLEAVGRPVAALVVAGSPAPLGPPAEPLHLLDDACLVATLIRFGGTPRELLEDPELLELFLPTIRADLRLAETYLAGDARVQCPLRAYVGSDDPEVSADDALDWARLTTGPFSLAELPGGHFFVDEHAATLLSAQ